MGAHRNISIDKFPLQTDWVGKPVRVCFHYDATRYIEGQILRDDREEPFITIIKLTDGRYVLAHECMYSELLK